MNEKQFTQLKNIFCDIRKIDHSKLIELITKNFDIQIYLSGSSVIQVFKNDFYCRDLDLILMK